MRLHGLIPRSERGAGACPPHVFLEAGSVGAAYDVTTHDGLIFLGGSDFNAFDVGFQRAFFVPELRRW